MSTSIKQIPNQIDAALRHPWQVRALAVLDAIIVNVVILAVARVALGEFPRASVGGDEQAIGFPEVVVATAVAGLVAALLLAVLERVSDRGKMIWTVVAVIVFLVSLGGPLGGGVDAASKFVLALLHIGAAATIIFLMRRSPATD